MRAQDGTPIALGFHTGHWEVGLLVAEAARELRGRQSSDSVRRSMHFRPMRLLTQGTDGMLDSLPYRNDAAMVLRRLMRSLPTRKGVPSASPPATRACLSNDDGAGSVRLR